MENIFITPSAFEPPERVNGCLTCTIDTTADTPPGKDYPVVTCYRCAQRNYLGRLATRYRSS